MIIGHQKIIQFLDRCLEKDRIAGAYLFYGPEHLGKFHVAQYFAKKLLDPENKNLENKKIIPDLFILEPEIEEKKGITKKKDIKIESIRELSHSLGLTAYAASRKVAIINDADRLTVSAQNALLKILEEPPQGAVIILVAHNAEKILPTVKSRCLARRFSLAGKEEIALALKDKKNLPEISFWSLGRPGLALTLEKETHEMEKRKEAERELKKIVQSNVNDRFALAEVLSKNTPELIDRMNLWLVLLRQIVLGASPVPNLDKKKALLLLEETQVSLGIIRSTNSNPRVILENLFLKF